MDYMDAMDDIYRNHPVHPDNTFHTETICEFIFLASIGLFTLFYPGIVCKMLFYSFMGFAGLLLSVLLFSFTVEVIVGCHREYTVYEDVEDDVLD
jgi:hypothetical protein